MKESTLRRYAIILLTCAVICIALLVPFRYLQDFNSFALIRPTDGLGPALGFVLGAPAIIGCALAWFVVQLAFGAELDWLLAGLVCQLIYLALPRLIWRGFVVLNNQIHISQQNLQATSSTTITSGNFDLSVPRLNTTGKVALYLVAALLSALFAGICMVPVDDAIMPASQMAHTYEFFHSFVFLTYLGLPVVIATSRRIGTRTGQRLGALGEVTVILFLITIAVIAIVFFAITYLVYIIDGTFTTTEEYMSLVNTFYVVVTELTLAGFVIMLCAVYAISRRATRPIEALTHAAVLFAEQLERRHLTKEKLEVKAIDEHSMSAALEVRELIDAVGSMQRDLISYIERFEQATAEKERVEAELDISHDIQASALPRDFSTQHARGLEIEGFMRPAREVGGDFYDVFDLDENRTAIVIGDVSGKGVPAALFMMRALSVIRSSIIAEDSLQHAFFTANNFLTEGNDATLFVTAFACVLDRSAATLYYVNAGHNQPSLRCGKQRTFLKTDPGFVLGVINNTSYPMGSVPFMPGDEIILYTDGVTEASTSDATMFGTEHLENVLAQWDNEEIHDERNKEPVSLSSPAIKGVCDTTINDNPSSSSDTSSFAAILISSIDQFAGDAPQADDIAILRLLWNLPVNQLEVVSVDSSLDTVHTWLDRAVKKFTNPPAVSQNKLNDKNQDDTWQKQLLFRLKLIAEELLINVSHHGSAEDKPVPVHFRIAYDKMLGLVYLGMEDKGVAYNLLKHETRTPTIDGPVGGMGIHLIRKFSDNASYARINVYNIHCLSVRV